MSKLVLGAALVVACAAPVQAAPPSNDSVHTAATVTSLPYRDYVSRPADATVEPDEPSACLRPPLGVPESYASTVWYAFDPPVPGRYGFLAMQHDSLLVSSVHVGEGPSLALFRAAPEPELLACARVYREGAPDRGTWVEAELAPRATYLIQIGCACRPAFLSELEFRMNLLPANDRLQDASAATGPSFTDRPFMGWASVDDADPRSCIDANEDPLLFGPTTTVWYAVSVTADSAVSVRAERPHGGPAIGIFEMRPDGPAPISCVVARDGEDTHAAGFRARADRTYLIQLIQESDNTLDLWTDVTIGTTPV